jgi:hypothetical protein
LCTIQRIGRLFLPDEPIITQPNERHLGPTANGGEAQSVIEAAAGVARSAPHSLMRQDTFWMKDAVLRVHVDEGGPMHQFNEIERFPLLVQLRMHRELLRVLKKPKRAGYLFNADLSSLASKCLQRVPHAIAAAKRVAGFGWQVTPL